VGIMYNQNTVLITGTTSGIGLELAKSYINMGYKVIGVDRRINETLQSDKNFHQEILNIVNINEVENLIKKIEGQKIITDIFILNAGFSIYDNTKYFDVIKLKKSFDINFYGAVNFASMIDKYFSNKKIIFFSSVSRFIPNPSILAYYSSKDLLFRLVKFLNMNNKKNIFKVAVLGPVRTNISRNLDNLKGVSKLIYNFLIVDAKTTADKIIKFTENDKPYFYFTKLAYVVCKIISIILFFIPKIILKNKKH